MIERLLLFPGTIDSDVPAFENLHETRSYEHVSRNVNSVASALSRLRELSPKLVAIHAEDTYRHWVLIMALASLGIASASLPLSREVIFERDLKILDPDIVISLENIKLSKNEVLFISESWFERVFQTSETLFVESFSDPDALVRVAVTAGVSTQPVAVGITHAQAESAILRLMYQTVSQSKWSDSRSHLISTIGLNVLSGFLIGCSALASGQCLLAVPPEEIGLFLAQDKPSLMVITPSQVSSLIEMLPSTFSRLEHLNLVIVAGKLTVPLYNRIQSKVTASVSVVYGTDDTGPLTFGNASEFLMDDMVGKILPWVSLQLVDEKGEMVSQGEEGIIRVRGTGVISITRGGTMHPNMRDGWFYPGDCGVMDSDSVLRLTGRIDDLATLGGEKFDLVALDETICALSGIHDAGSFLLSIPGEETQLCIALVCEGKSFDANILTNAIRVKYPNLPPVFAIQVNRIPRTERGEADRTMLRRGYEDSLSP